MMGREKGIGVRSPKMPHPGNLSTEVAVTSGTKSAVYF